MLSSSEISGSRSDFDKTSIKCVTEPNCHMDECLEHRDLTWLFIRARRSTGGVGWSRGGGKWGGVWKVSTLFRSNQWHFSRTTWHGAGPEVDTPEGVEGALRPSRWLVWDPFFLPFLAENLKLPHTSESLSPSLQPPPYPVPDWDPELTDCSPDIEPSSGSEFAAIRCQVIWSQFSVSALHIWIACLFFKRTSKLFAANEVLLTSCFGKINVSIWGGLKSLLYLYLLIHVK